MKYIVKWITYIQYFGGEIESDEEIEEEYDTLEEAQKEARKNKYGCRGQFVEVYINDKLVREYEV